MLTRQASIRERRYASIAAAARTKPRLTGPRSASSRPRELLEEGGVDHPPQREVNMQTEGREAANELVHAAARTITAASAKLRSMPAGGGKKPQRNLRNKTK